MKEQWIAWTEKFAQLQLREKYLFLGVALFLICYLLGFFLVNPMYKEYVKTSKSLLATQQSIKNNRQQIEMFENALLQDYTGQLRLEIEEAKQQLRRVDQQLQVFSQGFIPPYKMANVLKKVLVNNNKVSLVSFKLEPVNSITIGEGEQSVNVFFEHSMVLTLQGDFFSLLKYVEQIQKVEEKLFIKDFEYNVVEHPNAQLTLIIATVSADEKFISI